MGRQGGGGRDGGRDKWMRIMIERKKNRGMKDWRIEEKSMKYYSYSHRLASYEMKNSAYRLEGKHHLILDSKLLS